MIPKSNKHKSNVWLHIIKYGFGFSFVGVLLVFLKDSKVTIERLLEVSASAITLCIVAISVGLIVQSITQLLMARTLKVQLGWWESLSLTILGRAGNSFTPFRVGTVYRAIYMKTVHEMAFSKFVSIFFGFSLVAFGTSAIVATVSVIIVSAVYNAINWAIVFSLVIVLAISFFFVWLPGKFRWLEDMRNSSLAVALEGWYSIRSSRATFSTSIIGNFVSILTFIVAYKVVFAEIGSDLGWVECTMLASIGKIINLIQLVPGSLGIYEGSLAFLAHTFGLSPSAGLSVAILLRVCHLLILIALIGPSWIYLRNQMYRDHKKF